MLVRSGKTVYVNPIRKFASWQVKEHKKREEKKQRRKVKEVIERRLRRDIKVRERKRKSRQMHMRLVAMVETNKWKDQMERHLSPEEKRESIIRFEEKCKSFSHNVCLCCRMVGLSLKVNKSDFCSNCAKLKNKRHWLEENVLPVWYDTNNREHYELPEELKNLTMAECLLIQRLSPVVPLYHIKNGTFGLTGHCCSFVQDLNGFVNTLPRKESDVALLKVLQTVKREVGPGKGSQVKAYMVNRRKVLEALHWLQKHNIAYSDIRIDPSHLDWFEGESGELIGKTIETDTVTTTADQDCKNADMGPAPKQAMDPSKMGDNVQEFAYIDNGEKTNVQGTDKIIADTLREATRRSPKAKFISCEWPSQSTEPVCEWSTRIFANAFPWLFPGGIGDVKDFPRSRKSSPADWGEMMLRYEDGRFARDPIFGFYATNYIMRERNNNGGRWFIDNSFYNIPNSLDELKSLILDGETKFLNSITYYSTRVEGSSPYWFKKRCEVQQWIGHHIEAGNGPPMFFITFSCAEYMWPDIISLVKERMDIAGEDSSRCHLGAPGLTKILNQYSIVVQEYFQKRVVEWLETVGRDIFGVKHYWIRYEFAPGRGQIHAHLLAIARDNSIYHMCHCDLQQEDGVNKRAKRIAEWAQAKFGLTATVCDGFDDLNITEHNSPIRFRFSDVDEFEIESDVDKMMNHVQVHECSKFCLRTPKAGTTLERKHRECKCGCGQEKTAGECDTPGWPLTSVPSVHHDKRRSLKLFMPRNHPRLNQTSREMLRSWRGNCDIQFLVYNCDPYCPDTSEISRVTDYVSSYSTKGNTTLREEIEHNKNLILQAESYTNDRRDLKLVCKKILNKTASKRIISKQESMVLLGRLDLTNCTEGFETVSMSLSSRISVKPGKAEQGSRKEEPKSGKDKFIKQYMMRGHEYEDYSLYRYFHLIYNSNERRQQRSGGKYLIPNFVGISGRPQYPVTSGYAKSVLLVYKPWRRYPCKQNPYWEQEFNAFINGQTCPVSARMAYDREVRKFYDKMTPYDPKAQKMDHTGVGLTEEDEDLLFALGLKNNQRVTDEDERLFESMDFGRDFKWDAEPKPRSLVDPDIPCQEWLSAAIVKGELEERHDISVPLKHDKTEYTVDGLYPDQKAIVGVVMAVLREWLETDNLDDFTPLRMTINGGGGSGKSVVIHTIVTLMRKMFDCDDVIRVVAPTGSAAFNVGGTTIHNLVGENGNEGEYIPNGMKAATRMRLVKRFKVLLALVVDERSLATTKLIGTASRKVTETLYEGRQSAGSDWGSLPIVIFSGDDFQLPCIGKGALQVLTNKSGGKMEQLGRQTLLDASQLVMDLKSSKRINKDKKEDMNLMASLRVATEKEMPQKYVDRLMGLHLDVMKRKHGEEVVEEMTKGFTYIFYRNQDRTLHNMRQIAKECTPENPVAKTQLVCRGNNSGKSKQSHFGRGEPPETSMFCIGSLCSIQGQNFCPAWGLHNHACGIVEEIVYKEGDNPNNGDLPSYIVVHFPHYCGPIWDKNNPKSVPVPVASYKCKYQCCSRTYVPLTLAYAKTIHCFQGLSAGPVDKGKPANMFKGVICDPHTLDAETNCLGLLYTGVSRATTLGDPDGLNSAVYFTGLDMKKESRVTRLGQKTASLDSFKRVLDRRQWVAHLTLNTRKSHLSKNQEDAVLRWSRSNRVSYSSLMGRIDEYVKQGNKTDKQESSETCRKSIDGKRPSKRRRR